MPDFMNHQIALVKYQVATYSGTLHVTCTGYDEDEVVIAKAKRLLRARAGGFLPMGYESWKVIERS